MESLLFFALIILMANVLEFVVASIKGVIDVGSLANTAFILFVIYKVVMLS